MKKTLKAVMTSVLCIALLIAMIACSKDNASSSQNANDEKTKTVVVGLQNSSVPPFFEFEEDGTPIGFDYRVIEAVAKELPQYDFKYQFQEMTATLTGLDVGTVDVGLSLIEWNEERAEKYIYTETGYLDFNNYIVVRKDNNENWTTLDDLVGKRVITHNSSNTSYALEQYNKEHPGSEIEIVYSDSNDVHYASLASGDVDALISIEFSIEEYNAEHGETFKIIGYPVTESQCYIIINKGEPELAADIDAALKELVENGTIKSIEDELFGAYYDSFSNK